MVEHVVEHVTGPGGEHELLDGAVVLDPDHDLLVARVTQERVAQGPKFVQPDPSARFKPPVVIDLKFPSQYRFILKRKFHINDNGRFEPT